MSTEQRVRRFFDEYASTYDETLAERGWPVTDMLRVWLGKLGVSGTAVDLGAGTGLSTQAILDQPEIERVVAVDVSVKMLKRQYEQYGGDERLTLVYGSVEEYVKGDFERFDLAVSIGTVYYMPDQRAAIAGIARLLKPGGAAVFTYDPYIPDHPVHGAPTFEEESTIYPATYRSRPRAIRGYLAENNLACLSDERFVPRPVLDTDPNTAYLSQLVVATKLA